MHAGVFRFREFECDTAEEIARIVEINKWCSENLAGKWEAGFMYAYTVRVTKEDDLFLLALRFGSDGWVSRDDPAMRPGVVLYGANTSHPAWRST